MLSNLVATISRAGSNALLVGKKHLPEILVVSGIFGTVASVIAACKATTKAEEVLREKDAMMAQATEALNRTDVNYTAEDFANDEKIINRKTRWGIVKHYIPVVTLTLLSIFMILSGFHILHGRMVATAAAYKTIETAYRSYRQNVRDRYGEEADLAIIRGEPTPVAKIEGLSTDEDKANAVKKLSEMPSLAMGIPSPYAVYFSEETSRYWKPDVDANRFFLNMTQRELNEKFLSTGHLFLNEVYEALGMRFGKNGQPYTSVGQVVGWVMSKDGSTDNLVDFGMYDEDNRSARAFLSGKSNRILLDFNVDGVIYDLI